MTFSLDIITITRDDADGAIATLRSTERLRGNPGVRQIIVDGSGAPQREKIEAFARGQANVEYIFGRPDCTDAEYLEATRNWHLLRNLPAMSPKVIGEKMSVIPFSSGRAAWAAERHAASSQ